MMAKYNELTWRTDVYAAAKIWRSKCFFEDGALFSDENLWTLDNFRQLEVLNIANLDRGDKKFEEKLKIQLSADAESNNKPDSLIQLVAELRWFIYLISTSVKPEKKIAEIMNIFDWSSNALNDQYNCLDVNVLRGIANPGPHFSRNIFKYWVYIVTTMVEWKSRTSEQRNIYFKPESAWDFARWWDETWTKKYSELRNVPNPPSIQLRPQIRHALLFFLYPKYFERVVSWEDKKIICQEFIHEIDKETAEKYMQKGGFDSQIDTDQTIFAIREKLIKEHGKKIDFYCDPIKPLWWASKESQPTKKTLRGAIEKIKTSNSSSKQNGQSSPDAIEGNPKFYQYYAKARKSLRRPKLNKMGQPLECECCKTKCEIYPEKIRESAFEVHHRKALADYSTLGEQTNLDDLAILCANCHNAIHATKDLLDVEEFKQSLKSKCAGET
jgi:hypothetical protein